MCLHQFIYVAISCTVPRHELIVLQLLNTKADVTDLIPNMRGAAEIYGRELIQDAEYTIDEGEKLAVFTWVGCSLQVKGKVLQVCH